MRTLILLLLSAVPMFSVPMFSVPMFSAAAVNYDDDVKPILRRYCFQCHSASEARSGLNLETYQSLMRGGSSGEPIVPGRASTSLLYQVIAQEKAGVPRMPLGGGKLPDAAIAVLSEWIQLGAPENSKSPVMATASSVYTQSSQRNRPTTAAAAMPGKLPAIPRETTHFPHPVTALAASPWTPLLAVALHDRIAIYNTGSQKLLGEIAFPEGVPFVLRFSRDGSKLLAAGGHPVQSGRACIYDVATGRKLGVYGEERDEVLAADLSPDGSLLALGGPSKTVKVYRVADSTLAYSITKHTDWITAIEFSPDGSKLATGDRSAGLYLWEAATGHIFVPLAEHKDAITALSWRGDGALLASASEDGTLVIWNANDGFPSATVANAHASKPAPGVYAKPAGGILSVVFASDGTIASAGRDSQVKLWTADGKPKANAGPIDGLPTRVAVTFDNKLIVAGDDQGRLWSWTGSGGSKQMARFATLPASATAR